MNRVKATSTIKEYVLIDLATISDSFKALTDVEALSFKAINKVV
jgi:hypothetical protein